MPPGVLELKRLQLEIALLIFVEIMPQVIKVGDQVAVHTLLYMFQIHLLMMLAKIFLKEMMACNLNEEGMTARLRQHPFDFLGGKIASREMGGCSDKCACLFQCKRAKSAILKDVKKWGRGHRIRMANVVERLARGGYIGDQIIDTGQ